MCALWDVCLGDDVGVQEEMEYPIAFPKTVQ